MNEYSYHVNAHYKTVCGRKEFLQHYLTILSNEDFYIWSESHVMYYSLLQSHTTRYLVPSLCDWSTVGASGALRIYSHSTKATHCAGEMI